MPRFRRTYVALLLGAFALGFCVQQAYLLQDLLVRYMNEDHAILWLMSADWARLRPHEPTFYGQSYGINLEGIPVALLHGLGLAYGTALPAALIGMAGLAWLLLAWAALKRGMLLPGVVAAAAPLLVPTDHWIIVGVIGTGVGRLLAAATASLAWVARPTPWSAFAIVTMSGFAVAFDPAAATLAVPALVWAGWSWVPVRRTWLPAALGALGPVAWKLYNEWFDRAYTDHSLHPSTAFDPNWQVLKHNLVKPDQLFAQQSFELWQHGWVVLALFFVFWALTLLARAWREALAATSMLALLLAFMSLPKSLDAMNTIWFPSARMSLNTPMALWFAFALAMRAATGAWARFVPALQSAPLQYLALSAVAVASTWSVVERARGWREHLDDVEQTGLAEARLPLRTVREVEEMCDEAERAAQQADTRIVLFPGDRAGNYGCPAIYRDMITAYPSYERRYWVMRRLGFHAEDHLLVWGMGPKACKKKAARRAHLRCKKVGDHAVEITFPRQPALDVVRALGIGVRPFGRGCHPRQPETCERWAQRFKR